VAEIWEVAIAYTGIVPVLIEPIKELRDDKGTQKERVVRA